MPDRVERVFKRTRGWRGWAGSMEDLRKLGEATEEYMTKLALTLSESEIGGISLEQEKLHEHHKMREHLLEKWKSDLALQVNLKDGDDEITGPLDLVFPEVDRRSLAEIKFLGGRPYDSNRLELTFKRRPNSFYLGDSGAERAVVLKVTSTDQGWARQALSHLSEKIELSVPRWSWIHSLAGIWTLSGALTIAVFTILGTIGRFAHLFDNLGGNSLDWSAGSQVRSIASLIVLVVLSVGSGFLAFIRRIRYAMFPPLEFIENGRPTGTKLALYLSGLLVSVILAIFVNVVTAR